MQHEQFFFFTKQKFSAVSSVFVEESRKVFSDFPQPAFLCLCKCFSFSQHSESLSSAADIAYNIFLFSTLFFVFNKSLKTHESLLRRNFLSSSHFTSNKTSLYVQEMSIPFNEKRVSSFAMWLLLQLFPFHDNKLRSTCDLAECRRRFDWQRGSLAQYQTSSTFIFISFVSVFHYSQYFFCWPYRFIDNEPKYGSCSQSLCWLCFLSFFIRLLFPIRRSRNSKSVCLIGRTLSLGIVNQCDDCEGKSSSLHNRERVSAIATKKRGNSTSRKSLTKNISRTEKRNVFVLWKQFSDFFFSPSDSSTLSTQRDENCC